MNVLKLQIFNGDVMKEWITVERDVTKIGTLQSSHIILDGLSRMHAVIEREAGGTYRLIDLGGTPPTFVNGEQVMNVQLTSGDMIHFGAKGPWSMRVTIEKAEEVDAEPPPSKGETAQLLDEAIQMLKDMEPGGEFDSKKLFELFAAKAEKKGVLFDGTAEPEKDTTEMDALFEELCGKLSDFAAKDPDRKTSVEQIVELARVMWKGKNPEKKREQLDRLRDLVRSFEEGEKDKDRMGIAFVDSIIQMQVGGVMEKIFSLSEEEALQAAMDLLVEVSQYKDAFAVAKEMTAPEGDKEKEYWQRGKQLLEKKLTDELVRKAVTLSMYVARAGGWTWEQQQTSMKEAQGSMTEEQIQAIKEHPLGEKLLSAFPGLGGS